MKKEKSKAAALPKRVKQAMSVILALVLMLSLAVFPTAAADKVITNDENGIPDPVLYQALLSELDINGDGIIQKSEAEELQYFYYQGNEETGKISSLQGLNLFRNISILSLPFNNLQNLNGIEGLKIKELYVYNNQLTDIYAISNMSETLEILEITHNNVSKLPNMTGFYKLKYEVLYGFYNTTNFVYNKLTRNELYHNLPQHIVDHVTSETGIRIIDLWVSYQSPDPVPDPAFTNIVNDTTGISLAGIVIPDATLDVQQIEPDVENSVISYDINLIRDYEKIQPSGEITISIPCEYDNCNVFCVEEDGTMENMNAEYLNGFYVFKTDHLSVYSIVRNPIPGDVSGDGKVTLTDAISIQKAALSMTTLSGQALINADVNSDGTANMLDAILAQKIALQMNV